MCVLCTLYKCRGPTSFPYRKTRIRCDILFNICKGVTEFDVKQIVTGVGADNKMVCGMTEQSITVVFHTNNVMSQA